MLVHNNDELRISWVINRKRQPILKTNAESWIIIPRCSNKTSYQIYVSHSAMKKSFLQIASKSFLYNTRILRNSSWMGTCPWLTWGNETWNFRLGKLSKTIRSKNRQLKASHACRYSSSTWTWIVWKLNNPTLDNDVSNANFFRRHRNQILISMFNFVCKMHIHFHDRISKLLQSTLQVQRNLNFNSSQNEWKRKDHPHNADSNLPFRII